MKPAVLSLKGITKRFGKLMANDGISLDLGAGEVLALLGENGAGKSTLVSILFGHYLADEGGIEVFGQPLPPGNPRAALQAGIGMVHQHFTLADNLSVLDNVMLGTEPLWSWRSRRTAARAKLLDTAQRFGLMVDPDALIADLSVGERQRVEILKALVRGAKILILDEPTAVLTPAESESLFSTLRQLVNQGLSVIFISHKLDEVLRVSHRIAVLRGGKLVATMASADADKPRLAEVMVGRRVDAPMRRARAVGEIVCRLSGATVHTPTGRHLLDEVNLELRAGEIVAIAGVAGNGQQALAELLFGLQALHQGSVELLRRPMPAQPRAWVDAGTARIPEDRHAVGVVGDLPAWENAMLERYATPAFSRAGFIKRRAAQAHAEALIARFDVRGTESRGLDTPTRSLSGGNMQKLILGRELMGAPRTRSTAPDPPGPQGAPSWPLGSSPAWGGPALGLVGDLNANKPPVLIVADQPTWGLDIGAVAYVHQQLLDACAQGAAVLVISEDLEEIFALADRVAVIHHGRLTEARPAAQWTLSEIGLAMAGSQVGDRADLTDAAQGAILGSGASHAH